MMANSKVRPEIAPSTFPKDCSAIIAKAVQNFRGPGTELENAIGMLYLGHAFGWKVLYVQHSVATVKKYEKILGIVAKERFPESTEHSDRSIGYNIVKSLNNFWRVVRGVDKVEGAKDKRITA